MFSLFHGIGLYIKLRDERYWDALFCVGLDRRCTALHTCLCVFFLYVCGAKPTWRQEYRILIKKLGDREHTMCTVMGHCVFLYLPSTTANFPASHYYYEASNFAASFAVCWQYYSILHASVWYIVPAPMSWMIKDANARLVAAQSWAVVFSVF